jgi:hypothetical protein
MFAALFISVGLWPLIHDRGEVRIWAITIAVGFLMAAFLVPRALRPLHFLWLKFGELLQRLATPVVMAFLFFLVLTPVALVMRARGRDSLRLRRNPAAVSYWILRQPPGPAADSMKHQF